MNTNKTQNKGLGHGAVKDRGEVEQETTRSEPAEQESRVELKTPTVEQTRPKIPTVEQMTTSLEPMAQRTITADQAGLEQRA